MRDFRLRCRFHQKPGGLHMFVIRKEQMRAFDVLFVQPVYEQKMRTYLRSMHASAVASLDDASLGALVHALRLKAQHYGAADAIAWSQFTELWLALGPNFDATPAASSILLDHGIDWLAKVARVSRLAAPLLPGRST